MRIIDRLIIGSIKDSLLYYKRYIKDSLQVRTCVFEEQQSPLWLKGTKERIGEDEIRERRVGTDCERPFRPF